MKPFRYENFLITRVVDGDTVEIEVDVGFGFKRSKSLYRLSGINAPEYGQPGHDEAKAALSSRIHEVTSIQTYKPDKYGRWLVELYTPGEMLNAWMISSGNAKVY